MNRSTRRALGGGVLAAYLLLGAASEARSDEPSTTTVPATTVPPTTVPCQEDDPCWDCKTMGNGLCGPQPTGPTLIPAVSIVRSVEPIAATPVTAG